MQYFFFEGTAYLVDLMIRLAWHEANDHHEVIILRLGYLNILLDSLYMKNHEDDVSYEFVYEFVYELYM